LCSGILVPTALIHGGFIMLTVTIKEGQKLYIGDDIVVHLRPESIGSRQAKLSVEAPKDVVILREQLKGLDLKQ
jgi:sRNA-binding carbon storage regulator CsrA